MARTLLVVPATRDVGLTTVCLGLVRAFDRQGARVAFAKPLVSRADDHSAALVRLAARIEPPDPVAPQDAERLLAAGDDQTLMEEVVAVCSRAAERADVLVVEGVLPDGRAVFTTRVNALMAKALDAEIVLVGSPREQTSSEVAERLAIAAREYGPLAEGQQVSCVLNRVCTGLARADYEVEQFGPLSGECGACRGAKLGRIEIEAYTKALQAEGLRPIAIAPCERDLAAPRVKDVAAALRAKVVREGEISARRVRNVILCAMTVPNAVKYFEPGVLAITPGDRADIVLAAALSVQGGMALAGLVLTGGLVPGDDVLTLCRPALESGLPVVSVEEGSYAAAARLAAMDSEIPVDDADRVDLSARFVADHVDREWLASVAGTPRVPRLSPPAFRHRLVERARAANKRIVLPEGVEPRTLAAAAIAQSRGIARCVLMGAPDEIRDVAKKKGVTLPPEVEILDSTRVPSRYVDALVERRKAKGMTPEQAAKELSDTVVLGTMMMALGEADGLVSGAVHTTAHTIRPALQLIKTVPGCDLVSSVFFMCLPEQVLVFGDCAVVPNPTAKELAMIAVQSADSAQAFGIPPRVAMLSYSTGASGGGADVEKVKEATALARAMRPDLPIDGPLQYDAAVMPDVARQKLPNSPVAGKATVFVFPDLDSGNVTYKAVQRSANCVSIGPMLQGLARPVNDLSRGCLVDDIVFTIALTAIQAEQAAERLRRG